MNDRDLIDYWIDKIIIDLNLCPFAKPSIEDEAFFISHSNTDDFETNLRAFVGSLDKLMDSELLTNGLLYFPKWEINFFDFLDFTASCEEMLEDLEIEDQVQIVAFHPEFVFVDTDFDERSNYVNRSPYPLIHLIKTEVMDRAIANEKMGEEISIHNEKKLNSLNEEEFQKLFHYLRR